MSQNTPVSNANCWTEDHANSSQQNQYTCSSCSCRTFSTYRSLSQHNRHCTKRLSVVSISSSQSVNRSERAEVTNVFSPVTSFVWGERDGTLFTDDLNEAYQKIVFWRKIFLWYQLEMQERNTSKKSLDSWADEHNIQQRSISLKAIHTMPTLLLQKPSKTSKRREHLDALERRLHLWEWG